MSDYFTRVSTWSPFRAAPPGRARTCKATTRAYRKPSPGSMRWARPRGLLSVEPKVTAIPFDNSAVTPPGAPRSYAGIVPDYGLMTRAGGGGSVAMPTGLGPGGGKSGLVRVVELPGVLPQGGHAGGDWTSTACTVSSTRSSRLSSASPRSAGRALSSTLAAPRRSQAVRGLGTAPSSTFRSDPAAAPRGCPALP